MNGVRFAVAIALAAALAAPALADCPEMNVFNTSFGWSGSNGCTPQSPCGQSEAITFAVVTSGNGFSCATHRFTWDFGDETPISNEMTPVHHYPPLAGIQSYVVRLTITSGSGILILARQISFQSSPSTTTVPRIIYFLADASRTMRGQPVTLSWNIDNSYMIKIDPIGYEVGGISTGSHTFVPERTATYILTAFGTAASAIRSVDVEVIDAPCLEKPPAVAIDWIGQTSGCTRANGQPCKAGEEVLFSVQPFGSGVPSCFHEFGWTFSDGGASARQNPAHVFVGPGMQNIHLTVRNAAGSTDDSATLNGAATTFNTIAYFFVTPSTVTRGNPVTLQWSARNASQLSIEPLNLRTNDLNGSYVFTPAASTTYTMTALGDAAAPAATASVTVLDVPPRRRTVRH